MSENQSENIDGEKVPLIARAIGGRVLDPRPGKTIVTFWQGSVEVVLRVVVMIFSLAALIPAGVALSSNTAIRGETKKQERIGASGLVVGVASVTLCVELGFVVLRFLNVGIINYKIRWFLITDAVMSGALGLLFLGCTVAAGVASQKWNGEDNSVYEALAAATALCCYSMLFLGLLCIWSLLFMTNKWNKQVVVHTSAPSLRNTYSSI